MDDSASAGQDAPLTARSMKSRIGSLVVWWVIIPAAMWYSMPPFAAIDNWSFVSMLIVYGGVTAHLVIEFPLAEWLFLQPLKESVESHGKRVCRITYFNRKADHDARQVRNVFECAVVLRHAELVGAKKESVKLLWDTRDRLLQNLLGGVGLLVLGVLLTVVLQKAADAQGVQRTANTTGALAKVVMALVAITFFFQRVATFIGDRRKKNGEVLERVR